jgi:hypothetical protein
MLDKNSANRNVSITIQKIKEDGLETNFLLLFQKEDGGISVDEKDIPKAIEMLSKNNIKASEDQIIEIVDRLTDEKESKEQHYSSQETGEQKVKDAFLNGIVDEMLKLLVTNKNVLKIMERVSKNNDLDKFPDILLTKNGIEEANKILKKAKIQASEDEIHEAANILYNIRKLKEHYSSQETGEQKVKDAFLNGIVEDVYDIKKGYEKVMTMCLVTFYTGIFLIGAAVYSALVLREDILTLILGGIGGAGMLSSLIFRPAQEIQNSRGNMVKVKTAYLGWVNDLNNWNGYVLSRLKETGTISISELKECSEMMTKNLGYIMNILGPFAQGQNDQKETDKTGNS